METKLNYRRTFFIGLAFLSICAFWQAYDNIIPLMLQRTFGLGETVTGVLMAMDNVVALFLLPLFGSLSDKVDTPIGKRTPFILGGTILSVTFLLLIAHANYMAQLPLFLGMLFLALIAMGLYRSPAVALMPDLTPNHLRSRANAVINLMGAVGGVATLILIKFLVGPGRTPDYRPLFFAVAMLMAVPVVILLITIREKKLRRELAPILETAEGPGEEDEETARATAKAEGRHMPPEVKKSLIFLLVSVFLWFTAYNAVTTAFSRYAGEVWKMEGGGFADCLTVATAAAIISYIPLGALSVRLGRKCTIMLGVALMAICYAVAVFVNAYHPLVNIVFVLIGVAWAAINVNSYPMVVAMSKTGDVGKFTGTYYTFSMAAQILTPILSGALLEHVSYRTLFPYALVFSLLALITMSRVKYGDTEKAAKS